MKEYTFRVRTKSCRTVLASLVDSSHGIVECDGHAVVILDFPAGVSSTSAWRMTCGAARGYRSKLEHAAKNRANRAARRAAAQAVGVAWLDKEPEDAK